ncbi:uncharacterized protein fam163b isoform X1 [Stigmatopora nigra]
MEMEREQLRLEVYEMLDKLTVNDLLEICDFLNLESPECTSRVPLLCHIYSHLKRNELKDENKGMSEWLKLKEGIRMLYEDRRLGWQRLFGAKQAINSEHLASLEREKILKRDLEAMKQDQARHNEESDKQRRDLLEQLSARNEAIEIYKAEREKLRCENAELKNQLDKTVGCLAKAATDVEAKELKLLSYEEEIAQQKKLLALENLHTDEIVQSKDHIIKKLEEDISQQREAFPKKIDHLELQFEQAEQHKTDEISVLQEEKMALEKQVDMFVVEKEKLFQTKQATEREIRASLQREEVLKEELELLKLQKVTFLKETKPEPTEIQKSNWKEPSNKLVHVYNCTRCDVTGYSPSYLLFGSSVLQPGERILMENLTPRGGPGKLRDFWEDTVHTVEKQMGSDLPIYEVRPGRGKDRSRILYRNLLMSCEHLPVEITPEEGKIGTRTPRKKKQPASHQESEKEGDDEDDFHCELRQLKERGAQEMEPERGPLPVDRTHGVGGPASGPVQVEEDHQLEDLPGEGANPPLEGPSAEQLSETFPPTAVTEPEALTDERPRRERHPPRRTTYDHLGIPSCYSTQSPQERLIV